MYAIANRYSQELKRSAGECDRRGYVGRRVNNT
jgi:hypothetical protein